MALCVVHFEWKYSGRWVFRGGARERLEAWCIPGRVGLVDGMLCQLEAVSRAALRLDAVSDDSRGRTRKVEPGNELEGGRAQARRRASVPLPRVVACCP